MLPVVGYNRFPDEKGTEREPADKLSDKDDTLDACYNRFPDEKGTESKPVRACQLVSALRRKHSYNRFPDEKGTERLLLISAQK